MERAEPAVQPPPRGGFRVTLRAAVQILRNFVYLKNKTASFLILDYIHSLEIHRSSLLTDFWIRPIRKFTCSKFLLDHSGCEGGRGRFTVQWRYFLTISTLTKK